MTRVHPMSVLVSALGLWAVLALGGCAGDPEATPPVPQESPTESSAVPAIPEVQVGKPVAACEVPTSADRLGEDFWGMHVANPLEPDYPDAPISVVNLTTAGTYWPNIETAPGQRDWSRLDAIVDTVEERGATPVVVMGFSPIFHSSGEGAAARGQMPDVAAWEDHVRSMAERYGDRLDYQIWPEPNIVGNWSGTPAKMAELTIRAATVIEEVAPGARVVGPATTLRLRSQQRWMDQFWAASVAGRSPGDVVDAVAIDPFPTQEGTPEDTLKLVCAAAAIMEERGVEAPLWVNEINYGVPSGGNAGNVTHYPHAQQAAYVARTYLLHAAVGVDSVQWLGWGSYPGMAVAMTAGDGVTPTPAAAAYAAVHNWLDGRKRPECTVDDELYTCTTTGLEVHWTTGATTAVEAPEGATRVTTLDGASRAVSPGDNVEVSGQPVGVTVRRGHAEVE